MEDHYQFVADNIINTKLLSSLQDRVDLGLWKGADTFSTQQGN